MNPSATPSIEESTHMVKLEKLSLINTIRKPILNNAIFYVGYSLVGSFFGFVFWVVAARFFVPSKIGVMAALSNAVSLVILLGDVGMSAVILRFVPVVNERKVSFINSILVTTIMAVAIVSILFIAGTPWWSKGLISLSQDFLSAGLFIFTCVGFGIALACDHIFIAQQKTYLALIRALVSSVARISLFLSIATSNEITSFLLSHGLASLCAVALSLFYFLPKIVPDFSPIIPVSFQVLLGKIKYTAGNHYSNVISSLLPALVPILVLDLLGAENNAYFYTSWMIANFLFMIPMGISTSALTDTAKESANYVRKMLKIMWISLLALVPVFFIFILVSPYLLILFGKDYLVNDTLLNVLAISVFPFTVNAFVIQIFRLQQRVSKLVFVTSISTIFSLIFILILARPFDLMGVAYGLLLGQTLGAILSFLFVVREKEAKEA